MKRKPDLTARQEVAFNIMAIVFVVLCAFGLPRIFPRLFDPHDPVTIGIFVGAGIIIVIAMRKFIRDSTDSEGMPTSPHEE
ncbi:MAG: hypothetical protein IPP91_19400 [Betaproteobacteria bacterium]|nr:hypothetical protein [Betaproteobacteria bacterium]